MVLQMVSLLWSSPVCLLFVCAVFSHFSQVTFTRDELLNIRQLLQPLISSLISCCWKSCFVCVCVMFYVQVQLPSRVSDLS